MGNNRQQLKEKLTAEIHEKIEGVKKTLTSLDGAWKDVQRNSLTAQGQVQASFEFLQQLLIARKLKLVDQIDELSVTQAAIVQENIQKAYMELGNLQSTLIHLDSIDQSQLTYVQIKDLEPISIPPPVKTMLDSSALKDEISKWGSIYVDFANFGPKKSGEDKLSSKSTESANTIPQQKVLASAAEPTVPNKSNSLQFDIDYWLRQMNQTPEENDDFEMVFMDSDNSQSSNNKITDSKELSSKPSNCDKLDKLDATTVDVDEDDGSSIVCMDIIDEFDEDLTKWLNPKKVKQSPSANPDLSKWLKPKNTNNLSVNPPLVPLEVTQAKFNSGSTIASKSEFLDFPCLRMDPKCWLHKKGSKENINYNLRPDTGLSSNEKKIPFPPTFSLPDAFWLKKC